MNTAHMIQTHLADIILALTPQERWGSATRGLNSSEGSIPSWLIISGVAVVVVLIASSIVVTYRQKAHKK